MAKVIESDTGLKTVSSVYSFWKIVLVGLFLGLMYWGLTTLFERYVDSKSISSDIATILVATLGVVVMVRLHMTQPLIIAIASGASLWGLALLTDGLSWGEIAGWSILLYALAYTAFSWVARYTRVIPTLTTMVLIIIAVRIASAL